MPGIANYVGGSLHRLVAARQQHPDRAGQRRYFAERRLGTRLSSSAAAGGRSVASERKRAEINLGFASPKEATGVVERDGRSKLNNDLEGTAKDRLEETKIGLTSDRAPLDGERPAKKARTSTILQLIDDDPILSLDLHRQRLLAEEDWAGLDIKVEPFALRDPVLSASSDGVVDEISDLPLPKAPKRPVVRDWLADLAPVRTDSRLSSSQDTMNIESNIIDRVEQSTPSSIHSADGNLGASPPPAAHPNLERLASPPPECDRLSIRSTLADNPRSLFSVATASPKATSAAGNVSEDERPSPASTRSLAEAHTSGAPMRVRQTPVRENVSVTDQILTSRRTQRAGLATLAFGFQTDGQGVAQSRRQRNRHVSDDDLAPIVTQGQLRPSIADAGDNEPEPQPRLRNPFIFLAKALALKGLVGSSSDDR